MSITAAPVITTSDARPTPLWRTGALAGIAAAAATTVVAALALAADVPLEVGGEEIPLAGFAQATLIGAVIGIVLAKALVRWAARPQHTFAATTVALTALSLVPDALADATTATKLVLATTHVVAAAVIIPALASRLPQSTRN